MMKYAIAWDGFVFDGMGHRRADAVPMPCLCRAHTVPMPYLCRAYAEPVMNFAEIL